MVIMKLGAANVKFNNLDIKAVPLLLEFSASVDLI